MAWLYRGAPGPSMCQARPVEARKTLIFAVKRRISGALVDWRAG